MAALRAQSLVSVGTSSHGLALLPERRPRSQWAWSSNSATPSLYVNNKVCTRQKQSASERSIARIVCQARDSSSESDEKMFSENVDLSHIVLNSSSDVDLLEIASKSPASKKSNDSATHPPKFSTLRAFGEGGEGVMRGLEGSVFELLAANIEAAADLRRFETLSGRLAMMAFFVAIGVEVVTGNSVFKGIDVKELGQFAALAGLATVTAAGFAFAWRARSDVASSLSKGALKLVDTALDNVIDGIFYDDEEKFKQ